MDKSTDSATAWLVIGIIFTIVYVVVTIILSIKFGDIASDKGYSGGFVVLLCLLLSPIAAGLYVAAMPDLYLQQRAENIKNSLLDIKSAMEIKKPEIEVTPEPDEHSAADRLKSIPTLFRD